MKSVLGLSFAASLLVMAAPAVAQSGAIVQSTPSALAVERLNQNLNRLARAPTDMDALMGAGMASYELGDAQAANGFFTRANMVNPRLGRVKIGLALVSLALKQPRDAAAYFDEADALGEAASAYLPERALAYDLVGEQDKAQRDYVQALRAAPGNAELVRGYALSLGISGKVTEAEAAIRPLLFQSDRAAWRDRTMILAMNGRTAEARRIAQTVMPKTLSDAMDPYLQRMGALTPAQKAAAAHYGQFPAEGLRLAAVTSPPPSAAPARVETSSSRRKAKDKAKAATAVAQPAPASDDDSRLIAAMPHGDAPPAMVQAIPTESAQRGPTPAPARTGRDAGDDDPDGWTGVERTVAARSSAAQATKPATSQPATRVAALAPNATPRTVQPMAPARPAATPARAPASVIQPTVRQGASVQGPLIEPGNSATPAPPSASTVPQVQPVTSPPAAVASAPAASPPPLRSLASIIADIDVSEAERAPAPAVDLAEVARLQAAKRKAVADKAKKEAAAKAKAEADAKAKAEAEEKARLKANPSRNWVQIATGRDLGALAFDMRRLRKTYTVLGDLDAWTAEWGATRRLLVGPFPTATKAKAVLTDLKKAGSDGFVWQSEAGEVVETLSGK